MLWVKAFHIVFAASWFAGLLYLPRIFVNLAMVPQQSVAERDRLLLMARKLYRFTNLLSFPALGLGLWIAWVYWELPGFGRGPGNHWLHLKLLMVLLALGYQHACASQLRKFESGMATRSHVWFRWFNEVPVLILSVVVILVVVKPF